MKFNFQTKFFAVAALTFAVLICAAGLIIVNAGMQRAEQRSFGQTAENNHRPTEAATSQGESDNDSAAITARIHQALIESAAKLVDLRIVVAEKGDFVKRTDDMPVPVAFKQMWMHGTSAQLLLDSRPDGNGDEWWTGFNPIQGPLTTAHLASLPGFKACVDMTRELVYADSRILGDAPGGRFRTLHPVSKTTDLWHNLFVPLVELNKPWSAKNRLAASPVVNTIAGLPLSAWHLVGDENLGTEEAILVELHQHDPVAVPLKRHDGNLELTQMYLVWFAKNYGMMPLRVELSMRYGYQGREYRLASRDDGVSLFVYEAADFQKFGDVWVPRKGRQHSYMGKEGSQQAFDPDAIVDQLLSTGTVTSKDELQLGYSYEWKILDLQPIDPAMNLWFEPQDGAEVLNQETHKRYIQGDAVASEKFAAQERAIEALVGKAAPEFPTGATWLNGEPITWKALRGKVVILDFWSEWCGPCRGDLPRLSELHKNRDNNGLSIIGVHIAGSELPAVERVVADLQLDYPICIDIPNRGPIDESQFPSEFASQFAVIGIPHFVVVDQHGVVAASVMNRFADALAISERLAKAMD